MNRPSTSLVLALALALPACKEDAPAPAPGTPTPPPATTPAGTPAGTPATPEKPTTPAALTPAPVVPPSAPLAVAADTLLDLVTADAKSYVIIRAPQEFIDGFAGVVLGGKDAFSRLLDAMKDPAKGPDADAGMRKIFVEFDAVQAALAASGLHLERGMTITSTASSSHDVTVLAADDADAVPRLMRTLSVKPDEVKTTCKVLPDVPGFVACADEADALKEYQPGKAAAKLRTELDTKLGAATIEASNVIASVPETLGPVVFAVRTSDGVLQVDVRPPGIEPFVALDSPGPATALALVSPGSSFAWMRLDPAAIAGQAKEMPAMVGTMIGALSGEMLLASIGKTPGVVTLVGLTDSTPIAGLIPMAALAKDSIPKTMPDGSKLELVVETADDGSGGKLQVIRVKIDPVGELAAIRDQLKLASEVTVFVTKQWAAIGLGTGLAVIPDVAKATGGAPSSELLASLPVALAADLHAGQASLVTHIELDGLHAPGVREQLAASIGAVVPKDGKVAPADAIAAAFAVLATVSSMSMWASAATDGAVFHFAIRGFGDAVTPEGKAAQQARFDVTAGRKDAKTAYGELVTAYPTSARIEAYRVRAGQASGDGAPGAVAMAGVFSAIAIPAFTKYMERSKKEESKAAAAPK